MTLLQLAVAALWLALAGAAAAQSCSCGPDFCVGGPGVNSALASKRTALERSSEGSTPGVLALLALLDKRLRCVAAVERSPNQYSIMEVDAGGTVVVQTWTSEAEAAALSRLTAGSLQQVWLFHVRRRFMCCGRGRPENEPDWNAALQPNTDGAIACRVGDGGVATCG